jgi:hypothetical protein
VNNDVFPEVFMGTRSSAFFAGDIYLLVTFGLLPSEGRKLNGVSIGEVVAMKLADFNQDNWTDIVVGTRTSSSQGKLFVYFYDN